MFGHCACSFYLLKIDQVSSPRKADPSCRERGRRDCALSPCGRGQLRSVQEFEWVRGRVRLYPSPIRACKSIREPSPARGEGAFRATAGTTAERIAATESVITRSSPTVRSS